MLYQKASSSDETLLNDEDTRSSDLGSIVQKEGKRLDTIALRRWIDGGCTVATWAEEARASLSSMLTRASDSAGWAAIIEAWYKFETTSRDKSVNEVTIHLPLPQHRMLMDSNQGDVSLFNAPKLLNTWIQKHKRIVTQCPKISNINAFGADWRSWWTGLQPEWRRKSRRGQDTWPLKCSPFPGVEDWPDLKLHGQRGVFLVVLSLGWWMTGLQSAKDRKHWQSALDDVLWVLQHIAP